MKNILFLLLILFQVGCGFNVLYDDSLTKDEFSFEKELASIRIKKVRTKIDQELKNNLYDLLDPDNLKIEAKYFLELDLTKSVSATFITSSGASGRNSLTLEVKYKLYQLKTAKLISEGIISIRDNYDVIENRYSTYISEEFVMSNLTKIIAKDIRNALIYDITNFIKEQQDSKKSD
jgi:hypothetical protein